MTTPNATPRKLYTKCCAECGNEFQSVRREAEFCATECRKAYNNRRAQRGAELYDFVMALRFGDGEGGGRINEARDIIQSLASGYMEADKASRPGRRSYMKFSEAKANLNRLPGTADDR